MSVSEFRAALEAEIRRAAVEESIQKRGGEIGG
jgi:hypothetical protein